LRKCQCDWTGDPADLHDWEESGSNHRSYILLLSRAGNDGHTGKVDSVLNWCDDQITDENLKDLGPCRGTAVECSLEDVDEQVTERCRDEGAVDGHHGHSRSQVTAMFLVAGNKRGEKFLKGGQCTRRDHLRLKRVRLQETQVRLDVRLPDLLAFDSHFEYCMKTRLASLYL